jgi:hypothetical protein
LAAIGEAYPWIRSARMTSRWDETWHRLRDWTNGQAPSERLAAQILLSDGYTDLDPSHPLGGKDGTKDAVAEKDGKRWLMAVYFPRFQRSFKHIKRKFRDDLAGVASNKVDAMAFVTNQELKLAEREALRKAAGSVPVELYHLERITAILDTPAMAGVRKQFLGIDFSDADLLREVESLRSEVAQRQKHLESLQTGGDTFCYWMLYYFDMAKAIAKDLSVIRRGDYPLYDLSLRVVDMDAGRDLVREQLGEISSPAICWRVKWPLPESVYYRIFFHARNGSWHQDLILKRSSSAECWLAATHVKDRSGREIVFEHIDNGFVDEFGEPTWRP